MTAISHVALDSLGVLRARGADAASFLQGQLSNDLEQLGAEHSLLAGYHNPQGRAVALLRLLELAPGDLIAILPRELLGAVAARLAKFILRAKVKLSDDSAGWSIVGLIAADEPQQQPAAAAVPVTAALPATLNSVTRVQGSLIVRVAAEPGRWLALRPAAGAALAPPAAGPGDAAPWERLAVMSGEPEVYAATSEEFVAQMLNLDVLGGVAFDKGCYTGQEVIARAHFRGRLKRRLQRFVTRAPQALGPGAAGQLTDGRALKVVRAVQLPDGRCEFLAVAPLAIAASAGGEAAAAEGSLSIDAEPLALPYALPQ
jgi:folate-binding protein YgfZ